VILPEMFKNTVGGCAGVHVQGWYRNGWHFEKHDLTQ
jgi:hypothetical protein